MEAHAAQPTRSPGKILAEERERQGLGPAEIAQRLRMSPWQVQALEADDYARLPRGPFLRGFIRNYAKVLGLAPEVVLANLSEAAARGIAPQIVVPSQNIRFDPLSERISSPYVRAAAIAAVAVSLGFAAMYWWLFVRNAPPPGVARKPAAQSVVAAPVTAPAPAQVKPAAPPPAEAPKAEPAKSDLTIQRVAAAGTGGTLKLRFKGKAWVEIKDAGGRILLTGLNDPGSETQVSGKPPFRVIVGNAADVQMFVNDREFDLAPHVREAVARFTLE